MSTAQLDDLVVDHSYIILDLVESCNLHVGQCLTDHWPLIPRKLPICPHRLLEDAHGLHMRSFLQIDLLLDNVTRYIIEDVFENVLEDRMPRPGLFV